ncbi:MAG: methyltransferase domain-containing protein [Gammaproteobacteria bacterium]|jgi:SAM-dependent methyltransferase
MKILSRAHKEKRFNQCDDLAHTWPQLQTWYRTELGQDLAKHEAVALAETLPDLFGYHLLQLGRLGDEDWLQSSRISHCAVMDFQTPLVHPDEHRLFGLPNQLPLVSDSMDVLVLPHILEFSQHPHAILREAERVLIPEGHVVMLVFNPRSFWLLWRWLFGWRRKIPWCARFLSTTRIRDWMELLGFDVIRIQGYFYRPPLRSMAIMHRLGVLERLGRRFWPIMGAGNLVVARKRVVTMTPIRPRWRPRRQRVPATGLIEPFHHKGKHDNG